MILSFFGGIFLQKKVRAGKDQEEGLGLVVMILALLSLTCVMGKISFLSCFDDEVTADDAGWYLCVCVCVCVCVCCSWRLKYSPSFLLLPPSLPPAFSLFLSLSHSAHTHTHTHTQK